MSLFSDVKRITDPLRKKVFLLVGRGRTTASNSSEGTPRVQGEFLDGEVISDIERIEDYGLATNPEADSQMVCLFIDGNREQGLVVRAHDRRYRPTDLKSGEVALYHKTGTRILLKDNGDVEIDCKGKFDIKGRAQTLNGLLDELVDTLISAGTTGNPVAHALNPVTIAKLNAWKIKQNSLIGGN